MTLTETLAEHVVRFRDSDLPVPVAAATRRLILDTLAVAWGGADAPSGRAIRDVVAADGGATHTTLWAWGGKVPASSAAFVNGVSAAALDYDSVYEAGSVHADAVVVPSTWAVAEQLGASGREFVTAVALGTDIACRLGKASRKNSGWFYTSLAGVFGAAAACARLSGGTRDVVADAMGLALSNAAGTQQALVEKTVAKRLQSALAARAGVFCAQLACAGASAPRQALEGTYGYFTKYEDCDPAVLLADLGSVFEGTKSAIKKYPSCTANHAPLDAAITLAEEFDIDAGAVEEVEVTLSPFSARLVAGPFEPTSNPQVAAQFSIQYSMASALLRRRLAIADIQDAAVLHPAAGALAKRVRVVVDESSRGKFAPSRVVIVTKRCGRLERAVSLVPGTPENPLSSRDFRAKLVDCFGSGPQPMSLTAAERMMARVEGLADMTSMARFFDGGAARLAR